MREKVGIRLTIKSATQIVHSPAFALKWSNADGTRDLLKKLYQNLMPQELRHDLGEYYTPRPLIKAIVQVVDPQIGHTIYDGAVGSAGFLCEVLERGIVGEV